MAELAGVGIALLMLLGPGLVMTSGLFRGVHLEPAERLAIGLGLGLALLILAGIGLAIVGVPLGTRTWLVAIALTVLVGLALALPLGRSPAVMAGSGVAAQLPPASDRRRVRWTAGSAGRVAAYGAAALLALGGLVVSREAALGQPYPPYTDLWLIPNGADAQVGAESHEAGPTTYRIVVTSAGKTVARWSDVTLAPGQRWTGDVTLTSSTSAGGLAADLYRSGDTNPYRHVDWPAPSPSGSTAPSGATAPAGTAPASPGASP